MPLMVAPWKFDETRTWDATCELCEEARFTEWFFEDDLCWIAECDACAVPMVVWRNHSAQPSEEVRTHLCARLTEVMERCFDGRWKLDDRLRTIPTHYHAHARSLTWGPDALKRR